MAEIQYHKLRVLVADDFSSFRATMSSMLNKLGVGQVEAVASGREVLQWCRKRSFDLVLCDYDLGQGRNGQQVLEELRHHELLPPTSLFVMISADASRNVVMSAYDCEPDDYLMKPINARSLEQRLNRLLQQRAEMMPIYQALENKNQDMALSLLASKASGQHRYQVLSQKMLGELYMDMGEYRRAEQLYTKALQSRDLDWARLGLAKVKVALEDWDTAGEYLEQIVADNPLYLPAYDLLADVWRHRGDRQKWQSTIQQAVDISPMSIQRQQRLGEIAERNQDLATAVKAFRRSVRLGQLSCHARADDCFGFARTVAAEKERGVDQDSSIATEAVVALNGVGERFELSDSQQLQASVLAGRVHASQGRAEEARKVIGELDEAVLEQPDDLQTGMDMVAVWRSLGDMPRADALLKYLLERYKHDQLALEKLDVMLEEPASDSNRNWVARINRDGIELYNQSRYEEAIACFEQAGQLFPKNVGIQLNIAQSLVGRLRTRAEAGELSDEDFDTFNQTMDTIAELTDRNHPQYERYSRLRTMANSLRNNKQS